MMCGCSLAAFVFIIGASYKGMPISGTHTVIGALIGSGIAGVGVGGIGWNKLVRVIMSWFISPLVAMTISSSLFVIVCSTTLGGCFTSLRVRILSLYLISSLSFRCVYVDQNDFKASKTAFILASTCFRCVWSDWMQSCAGKNF